MKKSTIANHHGHHRHVTQNSSDSFRRLLSWRRLPCVEGLSELKVLIGVGRLTVGQGGSRCFSGGSNDIFSEVFTYLSRQLQKYKYRKKGGTFFIIVLVSASQVRIPIF
ncbi:hypothetical protein SCA6_012815 [Theobroma cacao]